MLDDSVPSSPTSAINKQIMHTRLMSIKYSDMTMIELIPSSDYKQFFLFTVAANKRCIKLYVIK